ncbi:MAG: UpxY family transcription antiterminator [Bacteroidota bacterium]
MSGAEKWYALYTNPRAEKKVAETLSAKGFENYLPLQTTLKQWSDRKKKVQEPLFKSYIFIKTDIARFLYEVLSINGIVKFIKTGKEISPVREEIIQAIKLSLLHFDAVELSPVKFALHEKVKVIAGPLAGIEGHVAELSSNQYFAIHIEQLGTSMLVKIPSRHLQQVS